MGVRPALHRGTILCRPRKRGARIAVSRTYLRRTFAFRGKEAMMQAIIERCCGLDVHQETVVACVLIGAPGERPRKEIRTFRTMTRDLEALRDWLQELGVTHVGMEEHGRLLAPGLRCA